MRALNALVTAIVFAGCGGDTFTISGTVSGLSGSGLVLTANGEDLTVTANGDFEFKKSLKKGTDYTVTVKAQPASPTQMCAVANGTGKAGDAIDVNVTCTTSVFTVAGNVTGLDGSGFVIQNNAGDDLPIATDGTFSFAMPVASGQPYNVTVFKQPTLRTQNCTVTAGMGMVTDKNVTDVAIACETSKFTVSANVMNLTGTGLVLQNNGGNDLPVSMNGPATFTMPVPSGDTYSVTVRTQPSGQQCTVSNGTGLVGAANITSASVDCVNTGIVWSPTLFPIAITGPGFGLGDMAFDANGDLLVVATQPTNAIVRVNRTNGAVTTVATGLGLNTNYALGVAYRAANNMIYACNDVGTIFAINSGGTVSTLTTQAGVNAITIAPAGFGNFGGFIIGGTNAGLVFAVNPVGGAITTITASAGSVSDLAFAPDGTLYVAGGNSVRTVTSAGVVATYATGLSSADGITIAGDGSRMFIADAGFDQVRQITIPGNVNTLVGSYDIDNGFFVGGILADSVNTVIVMTGETALSLRAFSF